MMACRRASMLLGLASLISMIAAPASATVSRLTVQSRQDVLDGRPFGAVGGYEKLVGTVEFALDPTSPANARIVDLQRAPRDPGGRVRATANFMVLRPKAMPRERAVALLEVSNRGGKAVLPYFARAEWSGGPAGDPPRRAARSVALRGRWVADRSRRGLRARPDLRAGLSRARPGRRRPRPRRGAGHDVVRQIRRVQPLPRSLGYWPRHLANGPVPATSRLPGLQHRRGRPHRIRRPIRAHRRRRAWQLQPPIRATLTRRPSVLRVLLSDRPLSVQRPQ